MSNGILKFDSDALKALIHKLGLERTWKGILYTHIKSLNKPDLSYILKSQEFADSEVLESDFIQGLTIGEISVLYEFSVALVNPVSRKDNGQFFTPDDVAVFMAEKAIKGPFRKSGVWLDPCSGIGNLSWHLANLQSDPETFISENLILSDRDELALLIARTLFVVRFQNNNKRLFHDLQKRFVRFDFLSVPKANELGMQGFAEDLDEIPVHDYVIVNPPYLATARDERFETSIAADLYAYFLENIIKSSSGFISVTPQSFTNASKFKSLRKLLLTYSFLNIYCFDNVPGNVFKGVKFGSKNSNTSNSIRAAITIASNKGSIHAITPLMRWTSSQRKDLFLNLDNFLCSPKLSEDFFPKVHPKFLELYKTCTGREQQTIADIVSSRGEYELYVPSSPRYFIVALKNPVSRSSMHRLYFSSKTKRDLAYLILNSSFTYWWWRVRDGGMTLSQQTLMSIPIPNGAPSSPSLVGKLEESELTNKVFKKNAGVNQENVKHDSSLVRKVNNLLLPLWSEALETLHGNSEITTMQLSQVNELKKKVDFEA
jgi:hypothetical protein